jgi:hypothetical protein
MPRDRRYYCVYIMGSLSGTLYAGFSGNLHKRVFQHNSITLRDSRISTMWSGSSIGHPMMTFIKR